MSFHLADAVFEIGLDFFCVFYEKSHSLLLILEKSSSVKINGPLFYFVAGVATGTVAVGTVIGNAPAAGATLTALAALTAPIVLLTWPIALSTAVSAEAAVLVEAPVATESSTFTAPWAAATAFVASARTVWLTPGSPLPPR